MAETTVFDDVHEAIRRLVALEKRLGGREWHRDPFHSDPLVDAAAALAEYRRKVYE